MVDRSDRRQAIRNEAIVVLHDYDTMYFYVAGGRWPLLLAGTTRLLVWPLARAPHHVCIARAASSLLYTNTSVRQAANDIPTSALLSTILTITYMI